jgi:hypothetical protein
MKTQCLQVAKMRYRLWHLGLRTDAVGEGSLPTVRSFGEKTLHGGTDGWELNAEML